MKGKMKPKRKPEESHKHMMPGGREMDDADMPMKGKMPKGGKAKRKGY